MRAASRPSSPATTTASRASSTTRGRPDTSGTISNTATQASKQADQALPDGPEPRRECLHEAQERALERSRRLRGDDTGKCQERGNQAGDVGRTPDARLIAGCCVEAAPGAQETTPIDAPMLCPR
jgi:hypothetical protein